MNVSRDTVGVVLVGTLAVVGLGLTAATITTAYSASIDAGSAGPGNGGGGAGNGDTIDRGEGQIEGPGGAQNPIEIPDICIEILTQAPVILGIVLGFLLMVAVAYRRKGFIAAGFIGYLVGLPFIVGYGLVTQCGGAAGRGGEEGGLFEGVTEVVGEAAGATTIPPVVLAAIFAVATIVAIGVLVSASRSSDVDIPEMEEDEEPGLEEFAAVAGEAADRIESTDASVDNAVYRAWLEMTTLLNLPDPDTSTAGEFGDAAIEAGIDKENIGDLTRLFEEVRYGDMDPRPREELALETLRNIEDTYGDVESSEESKDANYESGGNSDSHRSDENGDDDT